MCSALSSQIILDAQCMQLCEILFFCLPYSHRGMVDSYQFADISANTEGYNKDIILGHGTVAGVQCKSTGSPFESVLAIRGAD